MGTIATLGFVLLILIIAYHLCIAPEMDDFGRITNPTPDNAMGRWIVAQKEHLSNLPVKTVDVLFFTLFGLLIMIVISCFILANILK